MNDSSNLLLELSAVVRSYPEPAGRIPVLTGIDLSVKPGEWIAVTGPSGSGKTTLLNLIALLDTPDSGSIKLAGREVAGLPEDQAAKLRSRQLGMVFQLHHLLPQCSALENVLLPTIPAEIDGKTALARARSLLCRIGLESRMNHYPAQLSGGECQRVAVARALINSPGLLLADEPTGALDLHATDALLELLAGFHRDGMTILMVTHSERAAAAAQRRYVLGNGKLAQS
ncbi:MAG: ABC transporter ATP-binding protein [Victivallaceae bacterium]|jgi:ABC-type lipoprotein export system ATPase subunit